jgi:hypothetical protein
MVTLHLLACGRFFRDFTDGDGNIRADGATHPTVDTIFRMCLVRGEIPLRIHLFRNFQNMFGAGVYAQSAPLATVSFDIM